MDKQYEIVYLGWETNLPRHNGFVIKMSAYAPLRSDGKQQLITIRCNICIELHPQVAALYQYPVGYSTTIPDKPTHLPNKVSYVFDAKQLISFLPPGNILFVGHHVDVLYKKLCDHGLSIVPPITSMSTLCTHRMALHCMPEQVALHAPNPQSMLYALQLTNTISANTCIWRSEAEVLCLDLIFREMRRIHSASHKNQTMEAMIASLGRPYQYTSLPDSMANLLSQRMAGRHLSDIDDTYLRIVLEEVGDNDPDLRASLLRRLSMDDNQDDVQRTHDADIADTEEE